MTRDVVIIGGGIAGLSAACAIGQHATSVTLLEQEAIPFSHASGRNAAIYRPLEDHEVTTELAGRTPRLLAQLAPSETLLERSGLCLLSADLNSLAPHAARAQRLGVLHALLSEQDLKRQFPELAGGRNCAALHLPDGGVLDIHGIGEALRKQALAFGVQLRTHVEVKSVNHNGHRVTGVSVSDGTKVTASDVVLAAGAWTAQLAATCDASLPLTPYRRHLAQLIAPPEVAVTRSIHWDLDTGVYVRKEGTGLLATPGDHTPHKAVSPAVDPAALEQLAAKLGAVVPRYAESRVRQVWGCLRTMSPDRAMVIGRSAQLQGLYWFSGLGGHGMSAALAASHVLRDVFLDRPNPHEAALSVARFA